MSHKIFKPFLGAVLTVLVVLTVIGLSMTVKVQAEEESVFTLELLGEVQTPDGIRAIEVRDAVPNEIVFATRDTPNGPGRVWKMTLDPVTGAVVSILSKQVLYGIGSVSHVIFERSDETLFTGSGWLGFNPPYYSTDGGETWQTAGGGSIGGSYSTYIYAEFNGNIYAGTGYWGYHGKLHRWLGSGNWTQVFDYPPPRSTLGALAVHDGKLFLTAGIYWPNNSGWESSVPVYATSDGISYTPTTGIPPYNQIPYFFIVNGDLLAWGYSVLDASHRTVFRCNGLEWEELGPLTIGWVRPYRTAITDGRAIYESGKAPGDLLNGVCRSLDGGLTWEQIAVLDNPIALAFCVHKNVLYVGTNTSGNKAYIYRIKLLIEAAVDIDPGNLNLKNKGKWMTCHIELPTGYSAGDIDTGTVAVVKIGGNPIEPLYREGPVCLGDYDGDSIPDLMVKFDRQELIALIEGMGAENGETFDLTVSGQLIGGEPFQGNAAIKVISK